MKRMASILSFASNFLSKVVALEPFAVIETKIEDYVHYDIVTREDLLILHSVADSFKIDYEIVLHKHGEARKAFSIYRSVNEAEALEYFDQLKDKLPQFVTLYPKFMNVIDLQKLCQYIRSNSTQNLSHICAAFGMDSFFRTHSKDLRRMITEQDAFGETALHVAIKKEQLTVIQSLLEFPETLQILDNIGNNVLHLAAQTNGQIIEALCSAISSNNFSLLEMINSKNFNGLSPLYFACHQDKTNCVKILLQKGASFDGATTNQFGSSSPLNESNDRSFVHLLDVTDMKKGGTALHWSRSPEVIDILLGMKCDIDATNFHKETALHLMVVKTNLDCVLELLNHGADLNLTDQNGNTPLHLAVTANKISIVQALVVFGADLNIRNGLGQTPRHVAATSPKIDKEILFVLNSFGAERCKPNRGDCSSGCAPNSQYNGQCPLNFEKCCRTASVYDEILLAKVIEDKLQEKFQKQNRAKKIRLLSMDGGGIRGLIIIQILCHFERITKRKIIDLFDWIAGTSTGGILALLLSKGYSANDCRSIYFRLKKKIFNNSGQISGFRYQPYCSDTFEEILKEYLGPETKMNSISKPKLFIPATLTNRFPPEAFFYRNYRGPNQELSLCSRYGLGPSDSSEEYLWKVARATGAAPTYFTQFESFIDGGLISNNPTLDLITEIQYINRVDDIKTNGKHSIEMEMILSLGTGMIPKKPIDLNSNSLLSFSGMSWNLLKVLVEQASQSDGCVVDRAQAWCSMINLPYFRINPPISDNIPLDESDNSVLINMLWESMVYVYSNEKAITTLLSFFFD
ncbi:Guanine nucleotide-binding protein Go subunit alpha [Sarcoptes scabiei]|nr:Guanine nucleotide-binding protein Go subunit alpha [Sarcoptes scabiei]